MASQNATAAYVPQALNESNIVIRRVVAAGAMSTNDTLVVAPPPSVPTDLLPVSAIGYTLSGTVYTAVPVTITSHDALTGNTTLTANGALSAGGFILATYVCGA